MDKFMLNGLKLALIIVTKNRHNKLKKLLENIESQTVKPNLIIVIDASERPLALNLKEFSFSTKYIHTGPNSLTEARNIGIKNVSEDFNLVGFLDDDAMLKDNAIEVMRTFWEKAPETIGGVSFNVINDRQARKFWFIKKIFFTGNNMPGDVLLSGYQTFIENITENTYTKWLTGGSAIWRGKVFSKYIFDEALERQAINEDLDFSYRVGKEYKLMVLKDAVLYHEPHPITSGNHNIEFGVSEVVNRFDFVIKNREFSKTLFFWATFGQLLENFGKGLVSFNSGYLERFIGNILGIKKIICRKKSIKP